MEQFVFRKFIHKEVIQKTVIFADALGLRITGWHPRNTENHPHRIDFYSDGLWVGFVDAKVNPDFPSFVEDTMSFQLYTPFGAVSGVFATSSGTFFYTLQMVENDKIDGEFRVTKNRYTKEYDISSVMDLFIGIIDVARVEFNVGNTIINILRAREQLMVTSNTEELFIEHIKTWSAELQEICARINISIDNDENTSRANYSFRGVNGFEGQTIRLKDDTHSYDRKQKREKLGLICSEETLDLIEYYDQRMVSFLEGTKERFIFLANGLTPVSIFDRMAKICFYGSNQQFFYEFLRPKKVKIALDHNPVLKKINEPRK